MALLLTTLPLKLGLIAAALIGILVGVIVERLLPARRTVARLGEARPEAE